VPASNLLLNGKPVPKGYGLYSYLLFNTPPRDAQESERYRKTIDACLNIFQSVDQYLKRALQPGSLNVIYIPVTKVPNEQASSQDLAARLLASYDYATAQILLDSFSRDHERGPYLVSVRNPLPADRPPTNLWEDLSGVTPDLAWDWVKNFAYLAAQRRSWSDAALRQFGLDLRDLISVAGEVAPEVVEALDKSRAIEFSPGK